MDPCGINTAAGHAWWCNGLGRGPTPCRQRRIFIGAAVVVWHSGTHLSRLADAIARRIGIGRATLGAPLLGGVTSRPENAVAVSAALSGNGLSTNLSADRTLRSRRWRPLPDAAGSGANRRYRSDSEYHHAP
ncbi:hypothetical protein [Pseudooceanicola sp.]|uniref:hypothetical protein n=1 Tax=Pseudooceanicola sp. TaxID=1914328 RepID=UPI004058EA9B